MPEFDYVVPELIIQQKNVVFEVKDLYKILRSWGDLNRYDFLEKVYTQQKEDDQNKTDIKWIFERKIDDYVKFVIRIAFSIKGKEVSMKKKGKSVKGDVKIRFEAYLEKDYEKFWEGKPVRKFVRGFYDKFIAASRMMRYEAKLKQECYDIYNEAKSFLNLSVFH